MARSFSVSKALKRLVREVEGLMGKVARQEVRVAKAGAKPQKAKPQKRKAGRPAKVKSPKVSTGAKRGRPAGVSLKTHIASVLQSAGPEGLSVALIAERIQAANPQYTNQNLAKTVSITMKQVEGVEKVGHGVYRMSGAVAPVSATVASPVAAPASELEKSFESIVN